jgi:drug/metabolite transporter (DMT)-like permease
MPAAAFALALGAAFVHACWNLLLARARDPEAATAVALVAAVVVFAPVIPATWELDPRVWPFLAVTSVLELAYFALLARAYRRADLSFVYSISRGIAPVLVLLVSVIALGAATGAGQAAGVCFVGAGVFLVRGLAKPGHAADALLALAIAACIAAYTLVDDRGIPYANPIVYLELAMIPAALGYMSGMLAFHGRARIRSELRPASVLAGLLSFVAYVLVLAALERAPAAPVAAVRETSVVIAAALAVPVLGESFRPTRIVGAALVVAGVALLGL